MGFFYCFAPFFFFLIFNRNYFVASVLIDFDGLNCSFFERLCQTQPFLRLKRQLKRYFFLSCPLFFLFYWMQMLCSQDLNILGLYFWFLSPFCSFLYIFIIFYRFLSVLARFTGLYVSLSLLFLLFRPFCCCFSVGSRSGSGFCSGSCLFLLLFLLLFLASCFGLLGFGFLFAPSP